jgi:hypothetical protein
MTHKIVLAYAAAALLVLFAPAAHASVAAITITVDENGNGSVTNGLVTTPLTSGLQPDPGPGGLSSVLTYNLITSILSIPNLSVVAGDVRVVEPETGLVGDILRFNFTAGVTGGPPPLSTLLFYSKTPPTDSLADTPTPPTGSYTNQITLTEGLNGALIYAPGPNDPGFSLDAAITYDFISDSPVPLPAALPLFATGLGALGLLGWRRKRKAQA